MAQFSRFAFGSPRTLPINSFLLKLPKFCLCGLQARAPRDVTLLSDVQYANVLRKPHSVLPSWKVTTPGLFLVLIYDFMRVRSKLRKSAGKHRRLGGCPRCWGCAWEAMGSPIISRAKVIINLAKTQDAGIRDWILLICAQWNPKWQCFLLIV